MSVVIDLTDQVVLVTGGAKGVGAGIADAFAEAGAIVETCGRTASGHPTRHHEQVDVRDPNAVKAWLTAVDERHGRIDVVVNNAGGAPFVPFAEGSPNLHRKVAELNFLAAVYVAQAAYPYLSRTGGSIINVSSVSAQRASPGTAVYGAAKAALESLTRSLAVEWAPAIRVNAVRCGLIETEAALDHYGDAAQLARVAATVPRGQLGTPAEVGMACVMLASPLAAHISGAVLEVDGGGEWPAFLAETPHGTFQTEKDGHQ